MEKRKKKKKQNKKDVERETLFHLKRILETPSESIALFEVQKAIHDYVKGNSSINYSKITVSLSTTKGSGSSICYK